MARTQEVLLAMGAFKRKGLEAEEPAVAAAAAEPRREAEVQKQRRTNVAGRARLGALGYARMSTALAKRRKHRVRTRNREEEPSLAPSLPLLPQCMPKIVARLQQDERQELVHFISGFTDIFARMKQRDEQKTEALGRLQTQVAEMAAERLERQQSDELLWEHQSQAISRLKTQNQRLKELMNEGFSSRDEKISELTNQLARDHTGPFYAASGCGFQQGIQDESEQTC